MTKIKHHASQNLYECAYLLAKGFKLNGKEETGQKVTIFLEGDGIADEVLRYYNGGLVSAKKFTDAYRTLKDYVFER